MEPSNGEPPSTFQPCPVLRSIHCCPADAAAAAAPTAQRPAPTCFSLCTYSCAFSARKLNSSASAATSRGRVTAVPQRQRLT